MSKVYNCNPYINFLTTKLQLLETYASIISKSYTALEFAPGVVVFVQDIFEAMIASGDAKIRVHSINMSGGRVAVYYEGGDDSLWRKIASICKASSLVCDVCGEPKSVELSNGHFGVNRCSAHAEYIWETVSKETYDAYDNKLKEISKRFRAEAD